MIRAELLSALRSLLPEGRVLTDEVSRETFGRDWSEIAPPPPFAVILPRSTQEVRDVVLFANKHRVGLVPSGGRTGLSGGAVATDDELVLSLRDMNRILDFDEVDRAVRAEAGVVTGDLQAFAAARGLLYPIDHAASGASQIGGNIATNAGGVRVVRHGSTREWVAGLKVVTGRGDVLELNRGLIKNATGYDLRHLFIGSEGTLGVIVEATLRLTKAPAPRAVIFLAVRALGHLIDIFRLFRDKVEVNAFEFFSDLALHHVLSAHGLTSPIGASSAYYALVDFETKDMNEMEAGLQATQEAIDQAFADEAVVAQSETDARGLWRLREGITEALARYHPYKNDLSVVPSQVPSFLAEVEAVVAQKYPEFEVIWFGHIGDGNLHLNILKPERISQEEFFLRCDRVNEEIFAVVAEKGGSISAEHGIGVVRRPYLHYSRSAEEISYLRSIKAAFDPNWIMNPGKLFERDLTTDRLHEK